MIRILTVCLGNICRSPIAEELLRAKCQTAGLDVEVDSAGTANYHIGSPPDPRMIHTARKFGFDIQRLRARQFHASDFDAFDFIFTMDENNKRDVLRLAVNEEQKNKVFSFQDFAGISVPDYVPDPYYGTEKDFVETFQIVEKSAETIAAKLKKLHA
jgi:protein-tyrosine phosphatase